ncbi:MAG: hypothetical protein QNJ63_04650 [Calothrix sp. MO_192.B10]|nr:hypothetical protein [Calothrix sp. MO_192.B10]
MLNTFSEIARIYDLLRISIVLVGTNGLDNLIKKEPYIHDRFIECYRLKLVSEKEFPHLVQIWEEEILQLPVPSNPVEVIIKPQSLNFAKYFSQIPKLMV